MTEDKNFIERQEERISIHIFVVSAGLVGVCLTVIGIINLITSSRKFETLADNMTAIDALFFLTSCIVSYFAMKTRGRRVRLILERIADSVFLLALTLMAVVCVLIVSKLL